MHYQINQAIASLQSLGPGNISIRLTSGEHTPMGNLLHRMYYQMPGLLDLLPRGKTFGSEGTFGYPNNGGQHTFEYHGPARDFAVWLELFREELDTKFILTGEELEVSNQLSYIYQEIMQMM